MLGARTKGQTTLEVVLLISFVAAAVTAMGLYINRGTQGQLRKSADQVGELYDSTHTTSEFTINTFSTQTDPGGSGIVTVNSTQSKSGFEDVK